MRFLLARLYRAEYNDYRAGLCASHGSLSEVYEDVDCAHCGLRYFAERVDGRDPWMVVAYEYQAATRLARECPDHAHAFVVEG